MPNPHRRSKTRLQRPARSDRPREWPARKATESPRTPPGQDWRTKEEPAHAAVDRNDPRELNEEQLKRLSKEELLTIARRESLPNRSKMNKAQLARTLRKHFRNAA